MQKLYWLFFGATIGKNWATFYSNIWSHCIQLRLRLDFVVGGEKPFWGGLYLLQNGKYFFAMP